MQVCMYVWLYLHAPAIDSEGNGTNYSGNNENNSIKILSHANSQLHENQLTLNAAIYTINIVNFKYTYPHIYTYIHACEYVQYMEVV